MEQRREPRVKVDREVKITMIGAPGGECPGRLANFSGRGAGLLLGKMVVPGTLVKVEWDQTMVLGEVSFCRKSGEEYYVGLQLKHALYHTDELATLARRLRGEDTSARRPTPVLAGPTRW